MVCRYLLTHTDLGVAWLFNMVFSIGLVFLATWTVVKLAPEAAGGGVAEVMAYLNGCQLPKVHVVSCFVPLDSLQQEFMKLSGMVNFESARGRHMTLLRWMLKILERVSGFDCMGSCQSLLWPCETDRQSEITGCLTPPSQSKSIQAMGLCKGSCYDVHADHAAGQTCLPLQLHW